MDKRQKDTIISYNNTANEFMEKIGKLKNYDITYDYLINILNINDNILDLACGPAQISKYLKNKINVNVTGVDLSNEMLKIAKNYIPDGNFINNSIIKYKSNIQYKLVIIGFGIPYLNNEQTIECIKNSILSIENNGYIYISFMEGKTEGFEKTSFGGNNNFYIYYHNKENIEYILLNNGIKIEKEFIMDYKEPDGTITKDIIIIGKKIK